MEKIDKIISILRDLKEEGMVANAPGQGGGYGGSAPAEGPRAGFDPVMGKPKRNKKYLKLGTGSRKRWQRDGWDLGKEKT